MYILLKHTHLSLILLSVCFLIIRVFAASANAHWLQRKWAKVTPHIIDTLLLASAVGLMLVLHQYPIVNAWLTAKVGALLGYITFGFMALKGQKSPALRCAFLVIALAFIGYMVSIALTKNPMPWG